MITGVKTHKNQIVLSTVDQSTVSIVVSHNKEWKQQIETTLNSSAKEVDFPTTDVR